MRSHDTTVVALAHTASGLHVFEQTKFPDNWPLLNPSWILHRLTNLSLVRLWHVRRTSTVILFVSDPSKYRSGPFITSAGLNFAAIVSFPVWNNPAWCRISSQLQTVTTVVHLDILVCSWYWCYIKIIYAILWWYEVNYYYKIICMKHSFNSNKPINLL